MAKKKVKIKVKKRKLSIKKILIFLLVVLLIFFIMYFFSRMKIKNIYVVGNSILSDKEIIEQSNINDYPLIFKISSSSIKKKLGKNPYIEMVNVKKTYTGKLYIYIKEKNILCTFEDKILFEDNSVVENSYNITYYPILISDISNINDKFIKSFSKIDKEILLKISEIEYTPNEVDNERFALSMNDGNLVYVTLDKIEKMNKYNSIYSNLNGKRGIIYLDFGDYIEIKE